METKIHDNFALDDLLDTSPQDADVTPCLNKSLPYVLDSQAGNGAYTSGQVMFNAEYLASSSNYNDWSNAYIAMPFQMKLEGAYTTGSKTITANAGLTCCDYLTSMKNNSLINSITVSQGGRNIVAGSSSLAHLVNYKMLSTWDEETLKKQGPEINFEPDSEDSYLFVAGATNNGVTNNQNVLTDAQCVSSTGSYAIRSPINKGMLTRQRRLWGRPIAALQTTAQQKTECLPYQTTSSLTTPTVGGATATMSDIHFVAIVKLKDLSDYFDKHPKFTKGVGYQITVNVNQAVTTVVCASSTTPMAIIPTAADFSTATIGGATAQPAMLCIGPNTPAAFTTLSGADVLTLTLTAQIDTDSTNQRLSGVRLYVPSYELQSSTVEQIQRSVATKEKTFMDYYTTRISTLQSGVATSAQIASGLTNAKAIIIVPQVAASILGSASETSPYNPVPGCTDPLLSLTNVNIKLGSKFVLSDRVSYGFQQFIDNNAELFALNGNNSTQTSGLINYNMFKNNYRYYTYDLSRIQKNQEESPQMISIEATNNSAVSIDLVVFVLYGRKVSYNMTAGGMTVD